MPSWGCTDSSFSLRPVPFPTPSRLWPGNIVFKNYIRLRYHRNNYITAPSISYGNAHLLHSLYNGSSLGKKAALLQAALPMKNRLGILIPQTLIKLTNTNTDSHRRRSVQKEVMSPPAAFTILREGLTLFQVFPSNGQ